MLKPLPILVALAFAGGASAAIATTGGGNCEAITAQIDAKIRAAGVSRFTLTTVDADAKVGGKVVGSCDLGTKKIVYEAAAGDAAGEAASPRPPRGHPRDEPILTECKDGSVSLGGNCKN
jgi:hypothetical protein